MSDLMSTPSETQSAVSSDAFEALIDLLTSDGIDETTLPLPGDRTCGTQPVANMMLRDPSGKLDFDKIRNMFAAQHHRDSTIQNPLGKEKNDARCSTVPNEDGDTDEHRSLPTSPSSAPPRTTSMSPKPAERPGPGHRRSSTFGNQPLMAIHEKGTTAKVEDVAPTLQPLSFDELNAALVGAQEEVRSLRQQYNELQALVSKRLRTEKRDQVKPSQSTPDNQKAPVNENWRLVVPNALVPSTSVPLDMPPEIANLSEIGAKRALSGLMRSLNLLPSVIGPMATSTSPVQSTFLNAARQHDVASIVRTIKFLGTVDELVWRRASAISGPRTLLPVYSEENIVALLARLELWERAVRRSARA